MTLAHGINAIRPATVRIRGLMRRTPLLELKALQITGSSLKPRGAVDALLALPSARLQRVCNRFGWQSRARGGPSRLGGRNTTDAWAAPGTDGIALEPVC